MTAQNTRKPFGGRGCAPDPAEGTYNVPANPLVGGEGLSVHSPITPSPLSALRASPLLPHSKISSDAHANNFRRSLAAVYATKAILYKTI